MRDFIKNLLSESGSISTTRFVQIIGLFMAFIIAIIGICQQENLYAISVLCLSFIIPQGVAKVMQKKVEVLKK